MTPELTVADRIVGCLEAGALGDALGAPVEFLDHDEIVRLLGRDGVTEVLEPGHFTDDTQMTLFTCAGLLDAAMRLEATGTCLPRLQVYDAYLAWLATQGDEWASVRRPDGPMTPSPLLSATASLHRREAPGLTCLAALRSGAVGRIDHPINESKGCGGVMRAAPAGLLVPGFDVGTSPSEAYHLGCEVAAITHGHRLGIHPAGVLAALIHQLVVGVPLEAALDAALALAPDELVETIDRARSIGVAGMPSAATIDHSLGGGWVGDEALAIAVACSVAAPDLLSGLLSSVNHSGDTDSTGAITGNILGAVFGLPGIPDGWLESVDSLEIVATVAADVVRWVLDRPSAAAPDPTFAELFARYVA